MEPAKAASLPIAPQISPRDSVPTGWWRRSDVLAACFLFVLLAGLGAVWLVRSRDKADVVQCQSNLREIHSALVTYADNQPGKTLPQPEPEGPLAFAGVYASMLHDRGLLLDRKICCPSHEGNKLGIASCEDLKRWHREDPDRYREAIRKLNGSYAYTLGYSQDGRLHPLRLRSDSDLMPVLADQPPFSRSPNLAVNSRNHDGRGQNVLLLGGNVQFFTSRTVGYQGDDIYVNERNQVQPGLHPRDAVLASGGVAPHSD